MIIRDETYVKSCQITCAGRKDNFLPPGFLQIQWSRVQAKSSPATPLHLLLRTYDSRSIRLLNGSSSTINTFPYIHYAVKMAMQQETHKQKLIMIKLKLNSKEIPNIKFRQRINSF